MVNESQDRYKKKHFGTSENMKDFIPGHNLTPDMWKTHGFIVDKHLAKVGYMLRDNGCDVKIMPKDTDSEIVCAEAVKDNRIFVTSNLKLFNKKLSMLRCCLHYKANPQSKHTKLI